MKLSVIINTLNEGPRVRSTCQKFLEGGADEVVVCADGSTDGSCDRLPDKVVVLRNEVSRGCGKAKFQATMAASGDVLMWVDAHQNIDSGDIREMANSALTDEVVMNPGLASIFYTEAWEPRRYEGSKAVFFPNNESIRPDCSAQYATALPAVNHALGVGLCMSRRTYQRLGGWNQYRGIHGSQERGMALRAFMGGVPVVLDPKTVVGHEFFSSKSPSRNKNTGPFRFQNIVPGAANAWHALMTVCGQAAFESHLKPELENDAKLAPGHIAQQFAETLHDRDYFHHHCKCRPDDELVAWFQSLKKTQEIPRDQGGAVAEAAAIHHLKRLARGRCLELGTGSGAGTKAALEGCMEIVSVDHLPQYTEKAARSIGSDRAKCLTLPINPATGFYDVTTLAGRFDMIFIDGPPGTKARSQGIQSVVPLLAPGGIILVDDAKRDMANIEKAREQIGFQVEMLPTHRGLAKITLGQNG